LNGDRLGGRGRCPETEHAINFDLLTKLSSAFGEIELNNADEIGLTRYLARDLNIFWDARNPAASTAHELYRLWLPSRRLGN